MGSPPKARAANARADSPTYVTSIRFTTDEKQQLAQVARLQKTSVSGLIRGALIRDGALRGDN